MIKLNKVRATVANLYNSKNQRIEKKDLKWKEVEFDVQGIGGKDVLIKAGRQIFSNGYTFDEIEVIV